MSERPGTTPLVLLTDARKREELLALIGRADAITGVGHGLHLDEPVNAGSLAWANAAADTLVQLAQLSGDK